MAERHEFPAAWSIEEQGGQVRTIGPRDHVMLRVGPNRRDVIRVAIRLRDGIWGVDVECDGPLKIAPVASNSCRLRIGD